jgi:adenine-specific DNA-methyltransferase
MTKLDESDNVTEPKGAIAENLERMKTLFPEAWTEGKIDFDVLRQLLGAVVDSDDEKFRLTWRGKKQARQIALAPSAGTLRPQPGQSVAWDTTKNLIIEGDNLEVLKLLRKSYAGRVKLIYIDPPYNTGRDFIYPDDLHDGIRTYLELTGQTEGGRRVTTNAETNGRFHTDWLNMIYPRLKAALPLLSPDGVLLVSIDDNEVSNLRECLDELFGEENFLGTIVWRTATDNNPTQVATDHEYIVAYARDVAMLDTWERPSDRARTIQEKYEKLLAELGNNPEAIQGALRAWIRAAVKAGDIDLDAISHYSYVDARGVFYPGNSANTRPGGYDLEIVHPKTGETCTKPDNGFRWPMDTFRAAEARGDVLWGDDHTSVPKIKKRLESATELLKSSYYEDNRGSTNELKSLMGAKVFDNPKSPRLLKRLIGFITGPDDTVLDFFAGSGTTGEAVVAQNADDAGHRRYILVQLPEPLNAERKEQAIGAAFCDSIGKPRTIAELTKERLRRAAQKVKDSNPSFSGDLGFRAFKLDSSNIRAWQPQTADIEQLLMDSVDHVQAGRGEADLLCEMQLKRGLDLCADMEMRTVAGKTVCFSRDGALIACMAPAIGRADIEPLAEGIADWYTAFGEPADTVCVFRDSAFIDDVAKTNLAAALAQRGLSKMENI